MSQPDVMWALHVAAVSGDIYQPRHSDVRLPAVQRSVAALPRSAHLVSPRQVLLGRFHEFSPFRNLDLFLVFTLFAVGWNGRRSFLCTDTLLCVDLDFKWIYFQYIKSINHSDLLSPTTAHSDIKEEIKMFIFSFRMFLLKFLIARELNITTSQ